MNFLLSVEKERARQERERERERERIESPKSTQSPKCEVQPAHARMAAAKGNSSVYLLVCYYLENHIAKNALALTLPGAGSESAR